MPIAVSKRRAATAAVSALAAMALAAAVADRGCAGDRESPEEVVRALAAASRAGDAEAVLELLGPKTRARLERQAERATGLVGGSRRYVPSDLVRVGEPGEGGLPTHYEVIRREDRRATVQVTGGDSPPAHVTAVEVKGRWYVEIPGYTETE